MTRPRSTTPQAWVPAQRTQHGAGTAPAAARKAGRTDMLTLVVALERQAAAVVALLEHRLTRADPDDARRLRGQLACARRLEVLTARAADPAR